MLLILAFTLLGLAVLLVKKQYSHWETVGIPNLKAIFPFGNLLSVVRKENSFGIAIYEIYKQTKEPFLGIYLFFRPGILIRDPELVKNVLTTDFQHFHDRGVYCEPETDPMSATLFALPGEAWKSLRARLTPAFTSGKLKSMYPIIKNVGDELVKFMTPLADKNETIDIRDFAGRYVIDCLASIAFGQEDISTLHNPDHEFKSTGEKFNDNSKISSIIRGASVFICPKVLKLLRMKGLPPPFIRDFFLKLVTKTIEERESNNIVRKDLMQYLIQLRNNAENSTDDDWVINSSAKSKKSLTFEEIASQIFVFYIAGSESSSSTVAYCLYELTQNEDLLKKAQEDIEVTLEKHQGDLTYESIMDMSFIDLCVKETLRKYPTLPILNRECTKNYQIPGTNFTIEKGTPIIISLLGLHRDEKFFPNPEKYDPFRFTDDACDESMYMPFGKGARNCIAYRMGLLVAKIAIIMLLKNFNFKALSIKELEFDFGTIGLLPIKGQCKIKVMRK